MFNFCCIDLTRAARLIATIEMMISVIIINVITNDLTRPNKANEAQLEVSIGFEWTDVLPFDDGTPEFSGKTLPTIVLIYSIVFIVSCVILIFGSIMENRWCTLPWFICHFLSISCHVGSLLNHLLKPIKDDKHHTIIISTTVYLALSTYCCLIVYAAQRTWLNTRKITDLTDESVWTQTNNNSPVKTATNPDRSYLDSPPPYYSINYVEIS